MEEVQEMLKNIYYKMREDIENECYTAISNIFRRYRQNINPDEVKKLVNLIFIFNQYGIDTPHKAHKLLIKAKAQGIIGGDN